MPHQTVLATAENLSLGSDSPHDLDDKACLALVGLHYRWSRMDLEHTGLTHSVVSNTTIAKAKTIEKKARKSSELFYLFFMALKIAE